MVDQAEHPSLRDAARRVFWLDRPGFALQRESLRSATDCDLLVIGAGYTGLWAALQARERDAGRDIVVIDADHAGFGASGRNGGFCDASLTHGIANGLARFPDEIHQLLDAGRRNFAGLSDSIVRHTIDADFETPGQISVATAPWQLDAVRHDAEMLKQYGEEAVFLDRDALQDHVISPQYLGGTWHRSNNALVDPAKLVRGLADVLETHGVRIYDQTPCVAIDTDGAMIKVTTPLGEIRAARVVLATNAFRGAVPAIRRRVVPVWDYVLMTEPLSPKQRDEIGWHQRQGLSDAANLFHYFRLTTDNRILWGGYDAIYYFNDRVDVARREQRDATFNLLAEQFFAMFPQLVGLRFTHRWGGPIATTSRFCATFGTAFAGRVAFAVGYTGLGVAASRFGATVALALLDEPSSALRGLDFVKTAPYPFPPEPFRYAGIQLTRRAIARSDAREGRRGVWLQLLDRIGMGFDS